MPGGLTAAQITTAQQLAAGRVRDMSVETRNSIPSLAQIIDAATIFGIVLALGILGMSVGLVRSEAARDLRTLTATGAGGRTRRTITAATAGALAFTGAVVGIVGGYLAAIGFFRSNSLDGAVLADQHPGHQPADHPASACRSRRPSSAGCWPAATRPASRASRSSNANAIPANWNHGTVQEEDLKIFLLNGPVLRLRPPARPLAGTPPVQDRRRSSRQKQNPARARARARKIPVSTSCSGQ